MLFHPLSFFKWKIFIPSSLAFICPFRLNLNALHILPNAPDNFLLLSLKAHMYCNGSSYEQLSPCNAFIRFSSISHYPQALEVNGRVLNQFRKRPTQCLVEKTLQVKEPGEYTGHYSTPFSNGPILPGGPRAVPSSLPDCGWVFPRPWWG